MSEGDDDSVTNHPPRIPGRRKGWAGTTMAGCAPTEEVQDKLKRARDNKERLDILVAEYATASLRYAQRLRCVQFTPADVVQQMFVKIASRQALDRYSVSRAWITTCLKNAWCDLCRKHRVQPEPLSPELEAAAFTDFLLEDLQRKVRESITRLEKSVGNDPAQRALFDDWRHRKLDLPFDDSELQARFPAQLSSKRHHFAEQYDLKLARLLCLEFGVDRLEEIKGSLNRRSSQPPRRKGETQAEASSQPADGEQTSDSLASWTDVPAPEDA